MKHVFPYIVLLAAFTLAGSAAYYSVFGLSKLFSSQSLAIVILAGSLEASKLIAASYLHRYWNAISLAIKSYLISAVFILMCITSLGIYGFLVSAYQDTAYKFNNLETVIDNLETKKSRFETQLTQINTEKSAVNKNITSLTSALSNNVIQYTDRNGNQVVRTSSENRRAYELQLSSANARIDQLTLKQTALSDSVTAIDFEIMDLQTNSQIAAEIGPLKYIAKITGNTMDAVVNWLIILLIIVFDPLAIVLLISANKALIRKTNDVSEVTVISAEPQTVIKETKLEPEIILHPTVKEPPSTPQILSYWNKIRNDRANKKRK